MFPGCLYCTLDTGGNHQYDCPLYKFTMPMPEEKKMSEEEEKYFDEGFV